MSTGRLTFALALSVLAGTTRAQLVVGNDATTGAQIVLVDVNGIQPNRVLLADDNLARVNGLAADDVGQTLYWVTARAGLSRLYKAAYTSSGPITPIEIGPITVNGGADTVTNFMTGLAWDSVSNQLIGYCNSQGVATEGFISINTTTGAGTMVLLGTAIIAPATNLAAIDFGGIDFDASTNSFVGLQDSSSITSGINGRGLYRIPKPLAAPSALNPWTRLAQYPNTVTSGGTTADADIDGLAVGTLNGQTRAYLINDNPNEQFYVFNLSTMSYEANLASPLSNSGPPLFSGGAWAPGMMAPVTGANIAVSTTVPSDCQFQQGQNYTLVHVVSNTGPQAATGITLTNTLPAGHSYVSSTPAGTASAGVVTINVPGTMNVGGAQFVSIVVNAGTSGAATNVVGVTSAVSDPQTSNNTNTKNYVIGPGVPASPKAKAILSTVTGSASSNLTDPAYLGTKYSGANNAPGRPQRSPSGQYWMLSMDTDFPGTITDDVLLVGKAGEAFTKVVVQEFFTELVPPAPPVSAITAEGNFGGVYAINDSGVIGFKADGVANTATDQLLMRGTPGGTFAAPYTFAVVAREGDPAAAAGADTEFGDTFDSVRVTSAGAVSFFSTLRGTGVAASDNQAVFTVNGATVAARKGVTVPVGQPGGGTAALGSLDSGGAGNLGASGASDGSSRLVTGTLGIEPVAVLDGAIVALGGQVLGGSSFASPVAGITSAWQEAEGTVLLTGVNADGQEWASRNGVVVASTGSPIIAGATETFVDNGSSRSFVVLAANPRGDVVLAGMTDNADAKRNSVLVLNNARVIARENDAVDLNGNGVADDNAFIREFVADRAFATNGEAVLFVKLRDNNGALCGGADNDIGYALVTIPLPCVADVDDGSGTGVTDGGVGIEDLLYYLQLFEAGAVEADVDDGSGTNTLDGGVGIEDLLYYLLRFEAGC